MSIDRSSSKVEHKKIGHITTTQTYGEIIIQIYKAINKLDLKLFLKQALPHRGTHFGGGD